MSLKERLIKDTLLYSVANYLSMAIGIVLSVASKAVLGIAGAGYWAILKVFLSYSGLSDLGSKDAMLREVSQSIGAEDHEKAAATLGSAFVFLCAASAIFGAALFVASFFIRDETLRRCFWVLMFLVIATQTYNFMLTFLRVAKKVPQLSLVIVLNMISVSVFSLFCGWRWGVFGFVGGTLLATMLSTLVAYKGCGMKIRLRWDPTEVWRLVQIGFPLVLAGYAIDTFLCLDTLMIGKMLGVKYLGFYTIGLMSIQQINSLGRFSQIILIPHAQEKYGKSKLLHDTKPLFMRTTTVLIYILPVVIALVYFGVPVLVHFFIPKFIPGLPSMKILVLGYFFVAVNELSTSILFTINRQKDLVPIFAVMILLAGCLNYFFIKRGYGIEGVAMATAVSYFLFFIVLFCYAFRYLLDKRELWRIIFTVGGVFSYFSLLILNLEHWVVLDNLFFEGVLRMSLFMLLFLPFLIHLERKEGLLKTITRVFFDKTRAALGGVS